MRIWVPVLIAALLAGYFLVANVGSSMALGDYARRPILALTRDGGKVRVPVQMSGQPARPGEARILGGQGVPFGFTTGFGMPDGATVSCTMHFRTLTCSDGWIPERQPPAN